MAVVTLKIEFSGERWKGEHYFELNEAIVSQFDGPTLSELLQAGAIPGSVVISSVTESQPVQVYPQTEFFKGGRDE